MLTCLSPSMRLADVARRALKFADSGKIRRCLHGELSRVESLMTSTCADLNAKARVLLSPEVI